MKTIRSFKQSDIVHYEELNGNKWSRIYVDFTTELLDCPLQWQSQGLQQTASGYGSKLTSNFKILFEGKLYRLYTTIYSNVGSTWFTYKGKKIFVTC